MGLWEAAQPYILFLSVLAAWWIALALLARTDWFRRHNLAAMGPILLLKTTRGREVIDRVSQRRRFWRFSGDVSIALVLLGMVGITGLLLWEAVLVVQLPPERAPSPETLLGIPGLNPVIPLGYGIFGLAIAIVLHELAHGVLSRASGIRIQSLGVLLTILPIGAFVEPDEEEMKAMPRRERMRLYAVGPATNLVLAGVFLAGFSWGMMPSVEPWNEGVGVAYVEEDGPAENASVSPGSILTSLNGTATPNRAALSAVLLATPPNATVPAAVCYRGECSNRTVTLSWGWMDPTTKNATRARMGIQPVDLNLALFQPFGNGSDPMRGLLVYISLPLAGWMPLQPPHTDFFHITGPWAALPEPLFWILASGAYWLFWLDLMLGATNALPAVPLDGGYLFKDLLHGALARYRSWVPEEVRARTVNRVTLGFAFFILALIVWQFVGPWIL